MNTVDQHNPPALPKRLRPGTSLRLRENNNEPWHFAFVIASCWVFLPDDGREPACWRLDVWFFYRKQGDLTQQLREERHVGTNMLKFWEVVQ